MGAGGLSLLGVCEGVDRIFMYGIKSTHIFYNSSVSSVVERYSYEVLVTGSTPVRSIHFFTQQ